MQISSKSNSRISFYIVMSKIGVKLLPLLKLLKFWKLGLAAASFAAYSYLYTWQFSIALVIMLFVHEYGHVWEMKRQGMKVKGMYLIPFFGAVAVPEEAFPTRKSESYTALMGPIWGGLLSVLCFLLYFGTHIPYFGAIAGFMALINLLNLVPVMPLDWWRVFHAMVFSFNSKVGKILLLCVFLGGIILSFYAGIYLFTFLGILWFLEVLFETFAKNTNDISPMTWKELLLSSIGYISCFLILFGMIYVMKNIPEVKLAMDFLTDKS